MPSWRETRIARNEAHFREINERLEDGLRRVRDLPELQEFVCECGSPACEELVAMSFDEYEALRSDSRRFAVSPGHALPDAETVVAGDERYEVVQKSGDVVALVDDGDRRAGDGDGLRSGDPEP